MVLYLHALVFKKEFNRGTNLGVRLIFVDSFLFFGPLVVVFGVSSLGIVPYLHALVFTI
jgi:hypothetical protein